MKSIACIAAAAILMVTTNAPIASADTFVIDATHSNVKFSVRHMVISTTSGTFDSFAGTIVYEPGNPSACSVDVRIKAASINTRDEKRDEDLRGADFLDTEKYPEISFKSSRVYKKGNDWYAVGDLTIRGVSKPVKLVFEINGPITDPWGNTRMGIEVEKLKINRKDFGVSFHKVMETGGLLVGDEVAIELSVEAVVPRTTR